MMSFSTPAAAQQSYLPSCIWPAHFRPAVWLNDGSFTSKGHDVTEVERALVRAIDTWNVMGGSGAQLAYAGRTTQDTIDSAIVVHLAAPRGGSLVHADTYPNYDCSGDTIKSGRDICKTSTCLGGAKLTLYTSANWDFVADWIPAPSGPGIETRIDLWSIFQHELGHGLGLGHPPCVDDPNVDSVMCVLPTDYVTLGSQKRRYPYRRDTDALRGVNGTGSGIYDRPGLCLASSSSARSGWTAQHLGHSTINTPAIAFGYEENTTTPLVCVAFIDSSTGPDVTVATKRSVGGSFVDLTPTAFRTNSGLALTYADTADAARRRFVMAYTDAHTGQVMFTYSKDCKTWNPTSGPTALLSRVAPALVWDPASDRILVLAASRTDASLRASSAPAAAGPPYTFASQPQALSVAGQPIRSAYGPGISLNDGGGSGTVVWTDPVYRSGPDNEIELLARMSDFTVSAGGNVTVSSAPADGKSSFWKVGGTSGLETSTSTYWRLFASQAEVGANPAVSKLFRAARAGGSSFVYDTGNGGVWAGADMTYDHSSDTYMTLFAIP